MRQSSAAKQRVNVWFGDKPICEYDADPELADRYAAAMRRRFAGLRVTVKPTPPETRSPRETDSARVEGLPTDSRLWPLTVR